MELTGSKVTAEGAAKLRSAPDRAAPLGSTARSTVTATGISISAVAVLLTHIDTSPLAAKKPSTSPRGRVPERRTTA